MNTAKFNQFLNQLSESPKRNNQMENQQHTDQILRLIQNQPEEGEDVHAEWDRISDE